MGNHYNCIYMYTNLINGKRYVGKAKDFNRRYKEHLEGKKQLIDKKIKEYGQQNFKIEILIENVQDNDKLNEYEKFFIKRKRSHVSYGTGYNRTWGGDFGDVVSGMTDEQRKEYSKKISKAFKDKPLSEEHKQKLSEAHKGNKNPMYGVHRYGEDNPRARSVICLDTLDIFTTVKEAKKWCGGGAIGAQIKGQRNYAGKHPITGIKLHWMYYDEYLKLQVEEQQNSDNSDSTTNVA